LSALGYKIGIASRTGAIKDARQLIKFFGWDQYIDYQEIYPGCKVAHFTQFKKQSGIEFEQMLFFDDEERNIADINQMSILVDRGVSNNVIEEGLKCFVKVQEAKPNKGN